LLKREHSYESEKFVGRLEVDVIAELPQHRQQQVGRIEALAVDHGYSAILVDGVDEALNEDRLAG